ncbi:sensor domain-containing protein [Frankia sp. R82]|uniref:sensor histidine kinase n=1 Tax=Frankia sp. R82 TaxID=2950553 RepID=UPI002042EB45|nr:sensor domain-containing protein [Frankia sp. R82]MCM3882852.1 sensor domain-containing protein [Frankia sp. R82]
MTGMVEVGGAPTGARRPNGGVRALARATYAGPMWVATAFTALTSMLAVPVFLTVFVLIIMGVPLLLVALAGVPLIWAGLVTARLATRVDAWRFETILGRRLPLRPSPAHPPPADGVRARVGGELRRLRSGGSWLDACYALVVVPLFGWLGGWLLFVAWGGGLAFVLFPAYGFTLTAGDRVFGQDFGYGTSVTLHVGLGVAALLAAPWLARGLVAAHYQLARWLLSPREEELLAWRVEDLTSSRAGMVAAAAAERRRIERDLHDGAQQRLVAVAMTLGRAQARFAQDPDGAAGLVAEAHAEAKRALVELRDLARGIHPAVLTDRGLDAALSGLVACCPVPVTVDVDEATTRRRDPDAEAVAYFFVAEALTNVARHADATRVAVTVRRLPADLSVTGQGTVSHSHAGQGHLGQGAGRLVVEVADNGCGGAAERGGTGLAGLRDRARAVDGTFSLTSPPGIGTTLRLELPCAS